ncbi:uncharacterized protein B0H18DRAFT_1127156 [Fomitopsis serialis]|uniref:uncharacterized protein n=1 Tax=Fomitopsis serialis TaxID=139415 RepID=UPI0020083A7B|nr:uncharacterized protein B0H18DRAFT_1127156 [Neoantrodia serialis]KAH9912439.1 hypothetical protein B0H18DRAFT_1127156 [Neoantrodia serialis]
MSPDRVHQKNAFAVTGLAYAAVDSTDTATPYATVNPNAIPPLAHAVIPAENTSITSSFLQRQPTPVGEAVNILGLINRFRNPPSTPPHTPPRDAERTAATTIITPSSLRVHPDEFTPRKRDAAIAHHLNDRAKNIPLRSTVTVETPVIPPLLDSGPPLPPPDFYILSLPAPPDCMSRDELEGEVAALRAISTVSQATVTEQSHVIVGQRAQLILQNEHQIGTQARLNQKKKKKDNSHVATYLKKEQARGRTGRVYTEEGFRAAQAADLAQSEKAALEKLKGSASRVARSRRAKWRREKKEARKAMNTRKKKEYEEACRDCDADRTKRPRAPRAVPRDLTPEHLT